MTQALRPLQPGPPLFVGGPHHGQRRPVEPDADGKWPGVVDGYLFWRFEGAAKQWPAYYAPGAGQAELEDAVKIAGWPRWSL